MPSLPGRPCAHRGCGAAAAAGSRFCMRHDAERVRSFSSREPSEERRRSARLYASARWQHMRKVFLTAHPLCAECARNGIVTAATDVDHIQPHRNDIRLFYHYGNLQALCHSCHSRKTASEDGGFRNRRK